MIRLTTIFSFFRHLVERNAEQGMPASGQEVRYRRPWSLYSGLCAATGIFFIGAFELFHYQFPGFVGLLFLTAAALAAFGIVDRDFIHKQIPSHPNPKMLLAAKGLLGIGLFFCMLALVRPAADHARQAVTEGTQAHRNPAAKRELVSIDKTFSINVPASWEDDSELGRTAPGSVVHISDRANDVYLFGSVLKKSDIVWSSLERNAESRRQGIFETFVNPQLSSTLQFLISNHKAIQYEFNAESDNLRIVYLLTLIETDANVTTFMCWTLSSKYPEFGPAFKEAIASFQELPVQASGHR